MEEHQTSNFKIQSKSQQQNPKFKRVPLRDRLCRFAKSILVVCNKLPKRAECEGIRRQLARAGTAIGANFEEADGALTRKDFINKTGIARKEAKETRYWLMIIGGTYLPMDAVCLEKRECEEIINILSKILINSGYKRRQ